MGYTSRSGEQALVDFESRFGPFEGNHPDLIESLLEGSWVGREKIRYNFVLKYLSGHATNRGYYVHSFQDRKGNRFLSFLDCETITIPYSADDILDDNKYTEDHKISAGDCFSCKATVIRHGVNTFKYDRQPPSVRPILQNPFKETVLNRIKFKAFIGRTDASVMKTVFIPHRSQDTT